jgi:hypothetical protein
MVSCINGLDFKEGITIPKKKSETILLADERRIMSRE